MNQLLKLVFTAAFLSITFSAESSINEYEMAQKQEFINRIATIQSEIAPISWEAIEAAALEIYGDNVSVIEVKAAERNLGNEEISSIYLTKKLEGSPIGDKVRLEYLLLWNTGDEHGQPGVVPYPGIGPATHQ